MKTVSIPGHQIMLIVHRSLIHSSFHDNEGNYIADQLLEKVQMFKVQVNNSYRC